MVFEKSYLHLVGVLAVALSLGLGAGAPAAADLSQIRPKARPFFGGHMTRTRFEHKAGYEDWVQGAWRAMGSHGRQLIRTVPEDIGDWCPAYPVAGEAGRRAFWLGFLSALSKHESTYRAQAVGGGGLWYGLVQILPDTARRYGCQAQTGEALKDGAANLSCAIRILNVTVPRDGVVAGKSTRWLGVAADWGPLRVPSKHEEMRGWVRAQSYCRSHGETRPHARPSGLAEARRAPERAAMD